MFALNNLYNSINSNNVTGFSEYSPSYDFENIENSLEILGFKHVFSETSAL